MDTVKYSIADEVSENNECVYSEIHRVSLKCFKSREQELRLTLTVGKNEIGLHLTDDHDPFYLYSLVVTEEDFVEIKEQQSLLVSFGDFPSELVKLLNLCKVNIATQGPRFLLLLDNEDGKVGRFTYLKIVEANHFKHLCHLALKINCGSDADVMSVMAIKIKKLKDQSSSYFKELARTSSKLEECSNSLKLHRVEGEKFFAQHEVDKKNIIELETEISKEKEKLFSARLQWEEERKNLQIAHSSAVKSLREQIEDLSTQNQILLRKNLEEDTNKREKNGQLELHVKETIALKHEVSSLKMQNSKLHDECLERNKQVGALKTRINEFDQEIKDKTHVLEKQRELLKSINEQKIRLEDCAREKESALERKQMTLNNVTGELMKANEILSRLQAEMDAVKSKLRSRTQIALKQEQLLNNKTQELVESEKAVNSLRENLETAATRENNLRELLTAANCRIVALEKQATLDVADVGQMIRQYPESSHKRQDATGPTKFCASNVQNVHQGYDPISNLQELPQFMYRGVRNLPVQEADQQQATENYTANTALQPASYQAATSDNVASEEWLKSGSTDNQQLPQYFKTKSNAATIWPPKSSTAFHQPPRHATKFVAATKGPLAAYETPLIPPLNLKLLKQQHPVASAYFPKKGNQQGRKEI